MLHTQGLLAVSEHRSGKAAGVCSNPLHWAFFAAPRLPTDEPATAPLPPLASRRVAHSRAAAPCEPSPRRRGARRCPSKPRGQWLEDNSDLFVSRQPRHQVHDPVAKGGRPSLARRGLPVNSATVDPDDLRQPGPSMASNTESAEAAINSPEVGWRTRRRHRRARPKPITGSVAPGIQSPGRYGEPRQCDADADEAHHDVSHDDGEWPILGTPPAECAKHKDHRDAEHSDEPRQHSHSPADFSSKFLSHALIGWKRAAKHDLPYDVSIRSSSHPLQASLAVHDVVRLQRPRRLGWPSRLCSQR